MYGWINGGFTYNKEPTDSRLNGPLRFNDRATDGQGNQAYVVLEKPLDLDCCGGSCWGARVDAFYGSDARFTQVAGLEFHRDGTNKWNPAWDPTDPTASGRQHHVSMPQAYVEFGKGRTSIKAGHFYTTIGHETVMAPDNFFYSHSYAMTHGEPFTHTGAMVSLEVSDQLNAYGAVHNGWDVFYPLRSRAGYLGGFNWSSCDGSTTAALAITSGHELNNNGVFTGRTMYSAVVTKQIGCRGQYVVQHDNGWQNNFTGNGRRAEWYGINQSFLIACNPCCKVGARFEWFRDDDATRVTTQPTGNSFDGNYFAVTSGVNWSPTANVTFRPELRYDWFNNNAGNLPFNNGQDSYMLTAAIDGIFHF